CFVCGKSGATISCLEMGCDCRFHLPCAMEGCCVTQYFPPYRSFCWEHHLEQAVEVNPEANTTCLICLDQVEDKISHSTMVCPVCQHAWFHRGCIQGLALSAGITSFQCPLCGDKKEFVAEMMILGIQIPLRPPVWEDPQDFSLLDRHSRCDASKCLCPQGREWGKVDEEGPWQLLLCSSCAAEGTHRSCSGLDTSTDSWECSSC
ncbi:PHF7 protein, partial [Rhinopomastus cyanomelas]|nr:PHF7 protein [Rhinopomastus cyanomelas]